MKKFKSWQAPVFAFFSTQFYRHLGSNGRGVGFKYLFVLLLLALAVSPLRGIGRYLEETESFWAQLSDQLPVVWIQSGELRIDRESPCVLTDLEGTPLVEFDAEAQRSQTDQAPVMVTKHDLLIRVSQDREYHIALKNLGKVKFGPRELNSMLPFLIWGLPLTMFVIALPFIWLGHIIQTVFFAILGVVVGTMIGVRLGFAAYLRIAACAVGIGITLDALSHLVDLQFPLLEAAHWGLAKLVAVAGYTLFGVGANLSAPDFEPVTAYGDRPGDPPPS